MTDEPLLGAIDRRITKIEREIATAPEDRRAQLLDDLQALLLIIEALTRVGRPPPGALLR